MKNQLISFLFVGYVFGLSISGTIKDSKTGEPLPYANIIVSNTGIGTASDINGYYIIPSIDNGEYIVKVMMIGYSISENKIIINNENIRLNLELEPDIIDID